MREEGCDEPVLHSGAEMDDAFNTFDTYCPKYKTWNS